MSANNHQAANSTGNANLTGYGPRLCFDGDEQKYELWEMKFLGHMRLQKMYNIFIGDDQPTDEKNAMAFSQLIQYLDDKSLNLIVRDARDKGREALNILHEHYLGKSKPRIIYLYTQLTNLEMSEGESVTDYVIRAEKTSTALQAAGEKLSDSLLMAMMMKGLPEKYATFCAVMTQKDGEPTIQDFNTALKSYDENERCRQGSKVSDNDKILKTMTRQSRPITCFKCGKPNHKAFQCPMTSQHKPADGDGRRNYGSNRRKWCSTCRSSTHTNFECRIQKEQHAAKAVTGAVDNKVSDNENEHSFAFKVDYVKNDNVNEYVNDYLCKSVLVDCGATTHIITNREKFMSFNSQIDDHVIELADGSRSNDVVQGKGNASICIFDNVGTKHKVLLENALYIPSYKQDIFSVQAAVSKGGRVNFAPNKAELVTKSGTVFDIKQSGRLYYLNSLANSENVQSVTRSIKDWHQIMGHCNANDVAKLVPVVNGMKISDNSKFDCDICVQGKMPEFRCRNPDKKANVLFDLVHCDLSGPISPVAREGFKYSIMFVDDYSGLSMVYFLKNKSDTTAATKRFLADTACLGNVKRIRSDNGTEFLCESFKTLLVENKIKHELSAPYSPHQNGTVERGWRTIFEMARCLLLEAKLPKFLWTYAVQTSAYIRNRCFNNRLNMTPYEAATGKKPDMRRMHTFGTYCFAYSKDSTKLDPRSEKGIFLGYDKQSPAYLIYFKNQTIKRVRCVNFTDRFDDSSSSENCENNVPNVSEMCDEIVNQNVQYENERPVREIVKPKYLEDYVTSVENCNGENCDYLYEINDFEVPKSYEEAVCSDKSKKWVDAMHEEMNALGENNTYELCELPSDANLIGGRWVYAIKQNVDSSQNYKARYVAKGYSQIPNVDYGETFSPTARITSIRMLVQIAIQQNMFLHQMDVKTAFLNGPIDTELFVQQPKGFEKLGKHGNQLVWKLNKSLYGLKQSGRIWNLMLHDYLTGNGFVQSLADSCVYVKQNKKSRVILLIWVDDIIIAATNEVVLAEVKNGLNTQFKMKDLGQLKSFLNIQFVFHDDCIEMHQQNYIDKLLQKFGMESCNPKRTPCDLSVNKLKISDSTPLDDSNLYRKIVGSLIYVMSCTRPDICYSVTMLSQFLNNPTKAHLEWAKHVVRYLKGTKNQSLKFMKSGGLNLIGYCDSDWANLEDRRSVTGYCFSLNNGQFICWKTRKQSNVALSTCEAEYVALASATQEAKFLQQLFADLTTGTTEMVKIFVDNQSAIALAQNPVNHQRSKHIDIKYHFIRSEIQNGCIELEYISTDNNTADMFTKPLSHSRLQKLYSL